MLFCSFQCGVASIDVPKIVGGEEVMPNEIPWQAFLKIEKGDNTEYNCGGVLVDSDVVLTAAHCVTGVNIFYGEQLWRGSGGEWCGPHNGTLCYMGKYVYCYGVQLWGVLVESDVALTVAYCVTGVTIFYRVQLWRGPGGQ